MNKPLCKNLANIDRNKSVKFGVCKAAEMEISGEKKAFKYMNCNGNIQTRIDKAL